MTKEQLLNELYTNPQFPTAYSGQIQKFILEKESISRHKQKRKNFKRRQVFVPAPFTAIQADTIFYRNYARQNAGYKYILAVIDAFSRKNYVRAMKTNTATETAENLDDIISSMPMKPSQFSSDKGSEFSVTHPAIEEVLVEKYGMLIFQLKEPKKASLVERFIRTLKTRLERYFTETNSHRWIDVLQDLSDAINNSINRTIGLAPNAVTLENTPKIFKKLYGRKTPPIVCKYSIGDKVRIPLKRNIFDKGYSAAWSKEIFTIASVQNDKVVCFYTVKDSSGETVDKKFYTEEINLVVRNGTPPS